MDTPEYNKKTTRCTTITTFDGATGLQIEEGLIPATSPVALDLGGQAMKEEESTNLSIGITTTVMDDTQVTLDFYTVEVDDRIYRTGDRQRNDGTPGTVSFFTNVLNMEHSGIDLVVSRSVDWNSQTSTRFDFAYSYNKAEVVSQRLEGVVNESTLEDIENNYPNHRFVLSSNTALSDTMSLMVRANYYGAHYDERGTIGAAENPSAEIDATVYFDAELRYQWSDAVDVKLGFSNLFDTYIDEIDAPYANRQSVGLQYPRRSAANYEGGSWYLGTSYNF